MSRDFFGFSRRGEEKSEPLPWERKTTSAREEQSIVPDPDVPSDISINGSDSVSVPSLEDKASEIVADGVSEMHKIKARVHRKLLAQLNLSNLEGVEKEILEGEIKKVGHSLLQEENTPLSWQEKDEIVSLIIDEVFGLGPLEPLLRDHAISDILVNTHKVIYVERNGKLERSKIQFDDEPHLRQIIDRIVSQVGRRVDESSPMVDARLLDGSRFNAIIPPLAIDGSHISIRKFKKDVLGPQELVRLDSLTPEMLMVLSGIVRARLNIIISGGTGSGKCIAGDMPVLLGDGRMVNIQEIVESNFQRNGYIVDEEGWEYGICGDTVKSFNPDTFAIEDSPISLCWRHKVDSHLLHIVLASGRCITTTPEHPFYTLTAEGIRLVPADELSAEHAVCVPASMDMEGKEEFLPAYIKGESIYVVQDDWCRHRIFSLVEENGPTLASQVQCSKKQVDSWVKGAPIPYKVFQMLLVDALLKDVEHPASILIKAGGPTSSYQLPLYTTPQLMQLVGMILGSGTIRPDHIEFNNDSRELHEIFRDLIRRVFGTEAVFEPRGSKADRSRVYSRALSSILNEVFDIPFQGRGCETRVPEFSLGLSQSSLAGLMRGLLDTCGSIGEGSTPAVEFISKSSLLASDFSYLLLRFGIFARVQKGRTHTKCCVQSESDINKLCNAVSLTQSGKFAHLHSLSFSEEGDSCTDVFPHLGELITNIRSCCEISREAMADSLGVSQSTLEMYEQGLRSPSRSVTKKLCEHYKGYGEIEFIRLLVDSPIAWDKIDAVSKDENPQTFVYDLTVEGNHTFIAGFGGGVVAHNTTMLNLLSSFIPEDERVLTIEDAAELQLRQPHVVRLETKPANIEGKGEITQRELVKNALRMRPERIILGEIRSGEAVDMLQAMNTGHDGSLATLHANTPRDALARLETMISMAGLNLPDKAMRQQVASAVHVIIQANRFSDGSRKITHISEITGMEGETVTMQDIFTYKKYGVGEKGKVVGKFQAEGIRPKFAEKLAAAGIELPGHIFDNKDYQ